MLGFLIITFNNEYILFTKSLLSHWHKTDGPLSRIKHLQYNLEALYQTCYVDQH